jgi:eukaryotic-like serine/threonine-protein kinase
MLKCPKCLRQFDAGVTVCPADGTPLGAEATVPEADAAGARPADGLLGLVLDDKYRLDERLGEGGMGTVYRATHLLIERPVAVKVLSPRLVTDDAAKERFRREARAAGRLQHSNAVAVTDFGETRDGLVYLVMELLEGKPLREVLARDAPLDPARAVSLMLQTAGAVEAAHEAGIIHRDLKPGNIFLVQRPDSPYIVKVLDFGIAKIAADEEGNLMDTLTGTGVMIGTPRYMSPEQCDGAELTPSSDVYSLGVILYEMLTGQTPFSGVSPLALALAHSSEEPRPPRELVATVPPALEAVVLHALEKSPETRPADAGAFRRELFAVAERLGLEHSAGFSAPTIETLRDAGTETPSGRLVIDIERLRRSRAALTTELGLPTTEAETPDTSGRPAARDASGAEDVNGVSDVSDGGVRRSAPTPLMSSARAAENDESARAETPARDWKEWITQPLAFVIIISAALLLVFGAVLLRRSPLRRGGADVQALKAEGGSDDRVGRTFSDGDPTSRGTLVQQPRTAAEFYENGGYFISVRSFDAAVRDLREAVRLKPDFPEAHNRLGRALIFNGEFQAAAEEFRTAIEQRGGSYPVAQYNLGFALQQRGRFEEAVAAYRGAIDSNGGHYPDAYYQIGGALLQVNGRAAEAAEALRKAIEQNKGQDPEAYLKLGIAHAQQKDYAGAEAAFREAINQRGGEFSYGHYYLGLLYNDMGRLDDAVKEFDTYLEQSPSGEHQAITAGTIRDVRRRAERERKRKR